MAFIGGYTQRGPDTIARDPERWGELIASELSDRGLDVDLMGMAVNHPTSDERQAGDRLFHAFLRFATLAGSSGITILPGLVFDGERWQDAFGRSRQALQSRVDLAGEAGLRLSVEPHIVSTSPYRGSIIDTPERALHP